MAGAKRTEQRANRSNFKAEGIDLFISAMAGSKRAGERSRNAVNPTTQFSRTRGHVEEGSSAASKLNERIKKPRKSGIKLQIRYTAMLFRNECLNALSPVGSHATPAFRFVKTQKKTNFAHTKFNTHTVPISFIPNIFKRDLMLMMTPSRPNYARQHAKP